MNGVTKRYDIAIPARLAATDKTAEVGRLGQAIGRKIGDAITTQFAQDPDDYDVNITITMEAKNLD